MTDHIKASNGEIHYKIRQQDGTFQAMTCPDTQQNRLFVEWVQIHDGAHGSRKNA